MLWSNPQSKLVTSFKESERANKPGRILTGIPQPDYSGREALSHKVGSVCFQSFDGLPILPFGRWLVCGLMTCSLLSADQMLGKIRWQKDVEQCVLCLPGALWTVCWDAQITYECIRLPECQSQFIINHVILSWQFEKVWVGSLLSTRKGLVQPTILLP